MYSSDDSEHTSDNYEDNEHTSDSSDDDIIDYDEIKESFKSYISELSSYNSYDENIDKLKSFKLPKSYDSSNDELQNEINSVFDNIIENCDIINTKAADIINFDFSINFDGFDDIIENARIIREEATQMIESTEDMKYKINNYFNKIRGKI